jgi:ketosteroid isomerase-like protein
MRPAAALALALAAAAAAPARGATASDPPAQGAPARPADAPARGAAEQDARQIRAEIEGLHSALERFFADHKIEPVMKHYEALVQYFSPSGQREGRDQIRKRLQVHSARVKDFHTQVSPMTIRVSGDLGWAACAVHEAYTFDGKAGEEDLVSTYVLERKPSGWRIVHEHQSLYLGGEEDAAP